MKNTENENKVILEMSFKFQMKDYRLRLVSKKAWILALVIIALKIIASLYL